MTLDPGSLVEATYLPNWGIGVVEVAICDRRIVSFEIDGEPHVDEFNVHELEPAKPTLARTA